jgi:CRP-like cAMP-binding protein
MSKSASPAKLRPISEMESTGLYHYISQLAGVTADEFLPFKNMVMVRTVLRQSHFSKVGDQTRMVGFVLQGGFTVAYITRRGDEIIRNFCIEKMPIGSFATILTQQPCHVNITAFEDSLVAQIDYDQLLKLFKAHHAWERFGRRVAELHYISRENREYQLLAFSAEERYQSFLADYPGLSSRVTQSDIASYIGITPESLSRIRAKKKRPKPVQS